jgi:hypothetical protein
MAQPLDPVHINVAVESSTDLVNQDDFGDKQKEPLLQSESPTPASLAPASPPGPGSVASPSTGTTSAPYSINTAQSPSSSAGAESSAATAAKAAVGATGSVGGPASSSSPDRNQFFILRDFSRGEAAQFLSPPDELLAKVGSQSTLLLA